jgi:hypothetical protein
VHNPPPVRLCLAKQASKQAIMQACKQAIMQASKRHGHRNNDVACQIRSGELMGMLISNL